MSEKKLMRASEVANYLRVSQQTIWRWRKNKLFPFPEPLELGPRLVVFEKNKIDDWLDQQKK